MAKAPTGKTFNGSAKNDVISGTAYADTIFGNGGNDTITGGGGADAISGGSGGDVFRYLSYSDSRASSGIDTITDFNSALDTIDLTALGGATLVSSYDAALGGRQATLSFDGSRTTLSIYDGSSTAAFQLYLTGDHRSLAGIKGITAPPPVISVSDVSVDEGAGTVTFTIARSGVTTGSSTVSFATADGSAVAGADYTAHSGLLVFAAGETSKTVTVALIGDKAIEASETFLLRLSAPTDATIGTATATATIIDNDRPTEGADDLVGREGPEDIALLGGDDRFEGLGGGDTIFGGSGNDTIRGGSGDDFIDGGSGWDWVYGEGGDDRLVFAPTATDLDHLSGGDDRDTLDASAAGAALLFRAQKSGDDVSVGQLADGSTQAVVDGVEHWIGTAYGDAFSLASLSADLTVEAGQGDDQIAGGRGSDSLFGSDGNDTLDGNEGTNILSGGTGNDLLRIGRGTADSADGGDGSDTADLSGMATGAAVTGAANGSFTVDNGTLVASVVNVERLIATSFADQLDFTLATQIVTIDAGEGDDLVLGGEASDLLSGGGGADVFDGGNGADTLYGNAGDDRFVIAPTSNPSMDTIFGGEGTDTIDGRDVSAGIYVDGEYSQAATVYEKQGWALVARAYDVEGWFGSAGDDQFYLEGLVAGQTVSSGAGDDFLIGGQGNDILLGGDGTDFLRGWSGDDWIDGGAGVDQVMVTFYTRQQGLDLVFPENSAAAPWVITHDDGTDTLINVESLTIAASYYDDRVTGGWGNDAINGLYGNDWLSGGDGDDQLSGEHGADVLIGGLGADELNGGSWDGQDIYRYLQLADSNAATGIDTILNYGDMDDRIDISGIDIDASTSTVEAADWRFVGEQFRADVEAAQATLRYDEARQGTVLNLYLQDGDALADFELLIVGAPVNETILIGVSPLDPVA